MIEFHRSSKKRSTVLNTLIEWKYLGIHELLESLPYKTSRVGLNKFLRRLEKASLVDSFSTVFSDRRFYRASDYTHEQYTGEKARFLNDEIKTHDAILCSILYKLSKLDCISNPEFYSQNVLEPSPNSIDPDGVFTLITPNRVMNCALELELNRKSIPKVKEKFKKYYGKSTNGSVNSGYEIVIYIFSDFNILKLYHRYHSEVVQEIGLKSGEEKFVFAYTEKIAEAKFDIRKIQRLTLAGEIKTMEGIFLC